jgi:hypothetical protein
MRLAVSFWCCVRQRALQGFLLTSLLWHRGAQLLRTVTKPVGVVMVVCCVPNACLLQLLMSGLSCFWEFVWREHTCSCAPFLILHPPPPCPRLRCYQHVCACVCDSSRSFCCCSTERACTIPVCWVLSKRQQQGAFLRALVGILYPCQPSCPAGDSSAQMQGVFGT